MGQVRVRRSRLSPVAGIMMILLGILAFIYVNAYAGLILMVLGTIMLAAYRLLSRRPRQSGDAARGKH